MKIGKNERILEINRVKEMLKGYTASSLGKKAVDEMEIYHDIDILKMKQEEVTEAANIIIKRSSPPLFGINEIVPHLKHTLLGGSLYPGALIKIGDTLRVSGRLKKFLSNDDSDRQSSYPVIENLIGALYTNRALEQEIANAIVSEDEISDSASTRLRQIRQQIKNKKAEIKNRLEKIVTSQDTAKHLQDTVVTMRGDRYVVPVKSESKGKIQGIVHDMSASGQTVYIEPMAVVNLNNELRTLYIEEDTEIKRILEELSAKVAEVAKELMGNEEILKELDFIFAKGQMSIEMDGQAPILNEEGYINLKQARHPLIDREKVVPIDVYLGDTFTSFIITGPNTGGKTVTLKTVGLLTLMAQMGLHIPALSGSSIAIFDKVFVDIGDEQSIEQSLSTFSSHMVNIVKIVKEATPKSLVLFDELGAGTDPTEGAALARAIMDLMLEKQIRTIATTHYNQLKVYALTTEGVQNASMEFDVETLSPTFRVSIGVPGKSNAFEISKRLGLPSEIIDSAGSLINEDNIEFEEVLKAIEKDRSEIVRAKEDVLREREDLKIQNERLEKKLSQMEEREEKILRKAKEEGERILRRAREESQLALSEIKDVQKFLDSENSRRLQDAQDMLREGLNKVSDRSEKIVIEEVKNHSKDIKVGDTVKIPSLNQEGIVLENVDKSGDVMVQIGIMKMKLPKKSLIKIEREVEENKNKAAKILREKSQNISTEIDLRGRNFEEAKMEVDKYLDDAYISGLKRVRIIHGKGTGVLRQKLKSYLPGLKPVKSIEEAPLSEGGSGVTYVNLK